MIKVALTILLLTAAVPALAQGTDAVNPFDSAAPDVSPAPPASRAPRRRPAATRDHATLQAAQEAYGSDLVVWGNTRSRAYHVSGDKLFGKTKRGTYLCQAAAQQSGYHVAGQARHHS
jgi:hypothetical protein